MSCFTVLVFAYNYCPRLPPLTLLCLCRLPPLMDPANPYLPLCIVTLQDFLDTDGKSSTFDSSPQVCTSACCQLFMSKHGDTDPGALQGCSQCMARLDHFCNEVRYEGVKERANLP
eukprot:167072-Pelagomonas_calceolata.AAC.5